jgi:iron complex outermembrane receptor protein
MSLRRITPALVAGVLAISGGLALAVVPLGASAQTAAVVSFDIPAQDLGNALTEFARQSGQEMLYAPESVTGKVSAGVSGTLSREAAMEELLKGTGLRYEIHSSGSMIIGDDASIEAYRARLQTSSLDADAVTDAVAADPATVDPGSGASGEPTTASVETANRGGIEEIIVTGQKKEERLQDVPIAISAFSAEQLDAQKIEGGFDLLKAVPNVTFSKSNYSSYNFSIRGVGTKAVSATADPGVAVSFNNVPLLRNRLFEQEYFDVERVEVLRGPQGTLYGRNATGGVVNLITNKPDFHEFQGLLKAEGGNYNARRYNVMFNAPIIDDKLAVRFAASSTQRDGYSFNEATGEDSDNRDLWSTRLTIGFRPRDGVRAELIWEHFNEDDERLRTGKQLCHRDAGPATLPGLEGGELDLIARGRLSQGCKIGSLYDDAAFGTPNGWMLPFATIMQWRLAYVGLDPDESLPQQQRQIPLIRRDVNPYGDIPQSRNLRSFYSVIDPRYEAEADVLSFNLDIDVNDELVLSWQTAYNKDHVWSLQDYMRFETPPIFANTDLLYGMNGPGTPYKIDLPGGYYTDPQIGPANTLKGFEVSSSDSYQFSQELRLQSDFDGPVNFSIGANYLRFKGLNDYYLFFNILTLMAEGYFNDGQPYDPNRGVGVPVDRNPFESVTGDGHNYFRNKNPYQLESKSVFGELYVQATDTVKLTAGLRYTDDRKQFTPWPSHLLVGNSRGSYYGPEPDVELGWSEVTGRLGLDWQPDLAFTDQTMIYGFLSRGYKGGGMNPPPAIAGDERYQAVVPDVFKPEYVNAAEIGTKNMLLGGSMMLNGTAFFYDYKDYQVSKVQDRTIVNENFDAKVWGLELETLWRPLPQVGLNATVGYLQTEIGRGEQSLDIANRTQGREGWMTVSPWIQATSNCIRRVEEIVPMLNLYRMPMFEQVRDMLGGDSAALLDLCSYWDETTSAANPAANGGAGFKADIGGNELPNSPRLTFSLGAEYTQPLSAAWAITARGDYYRQSESWARVYEEAGDRLRAWDNVNLSLTLEQSIWDVAVQLYVKNVFDKTPITDAFMNSDSTGLSTNIFTLDPRLIGVSIRMGF